MKSTVVIWFTTFYAEQYQRINTTDCESHGMKTIQSESECKNASTALRLTYTVSGTSFWQGTPFGCKYHVRVKYNEVGLYFQPTVGNPYSNVPCGIFTGGRTHDCLCQKAIPGMLVFCYCCKFLMIPQFHVKEKLNCPRTTYFDNV